MSNNKYIIGGIIARIIKPFVKVRPKHWVFASNFGKTWGEGSKNMMLYVMNHDKSINCTYITKSPDVYKQLKAMDIPCELNWTLKGILTVLRADTMFFTHTGDDIDYFYKHKDRKCYYLAHGQAYKVALNCLRDKNKSEGKHKRTLKVYWKAFTHLILLGRKTYNDTAIISCCSDFIGQFTRQEFNKECELVVLGSPRNDILFWPGMLHDDFLESLKGKKVVTYMPTHRAYGKGKPSPTLFIHDEEKQQWLRDNNVVVLIKQHPNMIPQIKDSESSDVIIDVTKKGLDPQCTMVYSDVMITDYSSVWMDWLLMNKPLLHFFYDDFGTDDAGFYYDLHDDPAGKICESEDELFNAIKQCIISPETMLPSDRIVKKYHKYVDGDSCKRHYEKICERYS